MKDFGSIRKRTLLFLAIAAASTATAYAGVEVNNVNRAAGGNVVSFAVANGGTDQVADLQVYLNGYTHAVGCAAQTTHGNAFAVGGRLDGGDSVACTGTINGSEAHITAVGNGEDGAALSYTANMVSSPAAVPASAQVGILLGAVFNNTDNDFPAMFDAGETISLTFTVFNFGNTTLTGVSVTDDLSTAITCPGSTLAVGASMLCTGTYTLTATDATTGVVSDDGHITANGPGNLHADSDDSIIRTPSTAAEIRGLKSPRLLQDNDGNGVAGQGDQVGYTFAIKNSGSLPLNSVNAIEPDGSRINGGANGANTGITCNATTLGGSAFAGLGSGTLNVGDTVICTASYTINANDVSTGTANNLAQITGLTGLGLTASGSAASAFVVPTAPPPPPATPSPVNDWRALLLLGLGMLGLAFGFSRRRGTNV